MWSNERELEFLEYFQREPLLWNAKEIKHKDKQCMHDAWVRISELMGISVADLKKKRDSLMATYRSHKRKITASTLSGAGADAVYKPIWFAFDLMDSFLNDIVQCRKTMNTDAQSPPTPEIVILNEEVNDNHSEPTTSSQLPSIPRRRKNPVELEEAGKTMKEAMSSLNKVLNKPAVVEDDFDRYGTILANKLRKLSESESLKMMYEIDGLFIKRMNNTPTRPSPTYTVYSEPALRQQIPLTSPTTPTYYIRPESSCTSYSDSGVPTSSRVVSNPNTIQIISDEILRSPYPDYNSVNDVLSQAFHKA